MSKKLNKDYQDITKYTILHDNVLIEGLEVPQIKGILSPRGYEQKPKHGKVIAIGKGRIYDDGTLIPLSVKVDDIVTFNEHSTTNINLNGVDYYVVREEDIIGYLR